MYCCSSCIFSHWFDIQDRSIMYERQAISFTIRPRCNIFHFKGCGAQSDPLCNYDLLKMTPNDQRMCGLVSGPNPEPLLCVVCHGTAHGWTAGQERAPSFVLRPARAPMEALLFSSSLSLLEKQGLLRLAVIGEAPQATCCRTL